MVNPTDPIHLKNPSSDKYAGSASGDPAYSLAGLFRPTIQKF